jgi:putative flippase GtrA
MIEKLKQLLKSPRFAEIFRFGVNGGVCFVVDWSIMMLLMNFTNLPDWLCIGIGFTVSVILNYILCVVWVFKGAGKQDLKSQIVFIGSSVIGLGLTEVLMLFFMLFIHEAIAKVIVTLIVMVWNYFMKRIAVYGNKKKEANK